ncbi:hypothetical protein PR048_002619 [Dryococelus australis]|uniref:Uncharacterized protein n=1 Tax=Dryococelus australis TaxID=614101 RepID=A0ABQ9IKP9_9NEOP|nr:hypothetical protein PR048_002619 [Dryococelus australis]
MVIPVVPTQPLLVVSLPVQPVNWLRHNNSEAMQLQIQEAFAYKEGFLRQQSAVLCRRHLGSSLATTQLCCKHGTASLIPSSLLMRGHMSLPKTGVMLWSPTVRVARRCANAGCSATSASQPGCYINTPGGMITRSGPSVYKDGTMAARGHLAPAPPDVLPDHCQTGVPPVPAVERAPTQLPSANKNGAVPECNGRVNGKSQRKPAGQHSSYLIHTAVCWVAINRVAPGDAATFLAHVGACVELPSAAHRVLPRVVYEDNENYERHEQRHRLISEVACDLHGASDGTALRHPRWKEKGSGAEQQARKESKVRLCVALGVRYGSDLASEGLRREFRRELSFKVVRQRKFRTVYHRHPPARRNIHQWMNMSLNIGNSQKGKSSGRLSIAAESVGQVQGVCKETQEVDPCC